MTLLDFGVVTVVTMAVLTKAYGTDLGPFIGQMWAVYALYAFGLRVQHVVAVLGTVAGTVIETVGGLL